MALIVCGIAYGYKNYQGDKCGEAFDAIAASNQVRIKNVQARIDSIRTRETSVQARVAGIARRFSRPVKDGK